MRPSLTSRMPSTPTARRRIAVVLDGPGTPAWQQRALAGLRASSSLEVIAVRLTNPPRRSRPSRAHAAMERRLFRPGPDALEPVPVEADAPPLAAGDDTEIVIWLAEGAPPDDEAGAVVYLRHGGRVEPAEEAFRRAVLNGESVVESEAVLRRDGVGRVVERTVSAARPYSATISRDKALWKLAALVVRAAEHAGEARPPAPPALTDAPPALPDAEPAAPDAPQAPPDAPPALPDAPRGGPTTARLIASSPRRWARVLGARALWERPWQVLVREREEGGKPAAWGSGRAVGDGAAPELVRWRPGHAYADPFLLEHEGRHHLFCEEILPGSWRAVISHVELSVDGAPAGPPVPVLEAAYHLSYPCVFAHRGEVFLIPETSSQLRVELYRAIDFPHRWHREAVLLDGLAASDATLLEHDGRLWLFVNVAAPAATLLDELHLFSASELLGPWQPHPANPVVSDVRAGRPAGAIQRWESRLVRPAQDASRRYGGAISFREIDELTPERYAEHEIGRIDPAVLAARATHTYAADGRFEAVDLRRRQARLWRLRARLTAPDRRSGAQI